MSVEEQLQREAAGRRLAVAGAALGGALQLGGSIWREVAFKDAPTGKHKDAASLLFVHHHATPLIASSIVVGLGALAMVFALRHLYHATRFRRPELPPVALYCALAGPVLFFVGQLASSVFVAQKASDFAHLAHAMQTNHEAKHIVDAAGLKVSAGAALAGQLALGFAFVMISLNAMRVGLLTRFMGVLGIIVGVLFVIPIGSPVPVVQAFWLGALAYLLSGRWPNGVPPAWDTGKAEPWPSAQEMRDQARGDPAPEPEPPAPQAPANPGRQRRRKRKKRR